MGNKNEQESNHFFAYQYVLLTVQNTFFFFFANLLF